MKRPAILLFALLALLVGALALKGQLVTAPGVPEAAAPGEFDTARAMGRIERILADERPHPVDSAAGDAVRSRLIAELRAIGLTPRVTDDWACNGHPKSRSVSCSRVRNVLATVGPPDGRHVLVAVHYDSTPAGPGAADDGIGVAVALETAALLRDRKSARTVTFLFDEGEEAGLLGAKAFLERDPLASKVESVVNLEARGVSGPAIMFETSRPNGAAVAAFARSASRPVANSMTADFYSLIPNSTDVTVFALRPWTILNFAIIGNETRYHSPEDRLRNLDRRSVHHMGTRALAAAAELASGRAPAASRERLYGDVMGLGLVDIPLAAGLSLLALLIVGFVWVAWRRRGGMIRAAGAVVLALAGSAALAWAAQAALGLIRGGAYWRAHPELISSAIDVTAIAASAAVLGWLARPLARDRLRTGFWLLFLLLSAALAFVAPGAAIFSLLPPLIMLGGIALSRRWARAESVSALLAWGALFLSWAPILHLSQVLLDFGAGWTFAPLSALIALPLLIELKTLASRFSRPANLAAPFAAALVAWTAVGLAPAYSPERKQIFRIEYGWDESTRKAVWAVANDGAALPEGFTGFRDRVEVPWSTAKRWSAPAPPMPLPAPSLQKLGERPIGAGRILTLRLASGGADSVVLRAKAEAELRAVGVAGSSQAFGKGGAKEPFILRCAGRSCDGLVFELSLGADPVEASVIGMRSGLPEAAAPLLRARPATAGPQYGPDQSFAVSNVRL